MAGQFRQRAARRAVLVVALAVLVDPVGAVQALNSPAEQEIERARDAQERTEQAVADVQARLAALAAELDEARIRAAIAVEAYNGARYELSRARLHEEAAAGEAVEIRGERSAADVELGRRAAATYRSGGGWSELSVVMNVVTDASIVDISEALATVTRSQSVVHDRWSGALDEAESAVRAAERQVAELAATERAAEQALERAKQAVTEHEDAVARAAAMRDALILELAAARGTTAELERDRQRAQEQGEQAERERAARQQAERGQREDAPEEPGPESTQRDDAETEESAAPAPADEAGPATSAPEPAASSTIEAGTSFAGAAAAARAIDYARAQIGKPYVWAGAGPAGFDCSGLTMRAWERGGVQLTHWSVAQARQTVTVPYSDLRPGDLIFWSENDAPSGTYHVALYIGGGEMIHAPSPGGHVEIRDVFYWRTPSFYARVPA